MRDFSHLSCSKCAEWGTHIVHGTRYCANHAPADFMPTRRPSYGGETFDPSKDLARMNAQTKRVGKVMIDRRWRTLAEIAAITGDPESSISARLRDFRKEDFGKSKVNRQRRSEAQHEYQLLATQQTLELIFEKQWRAA